MHSPSRISFPTLQAINRCFTTTSLPPFSTEFITRIQLQLNRVNVIQLQPNLSLKKAAVLIPLCNVDREPSVLFSLRSKNLSKHGGQVSFPGGIEDPKDLNNPVLVALRETSEELNVTADAFSVIGVFHQAETSSQIQVTSVLGFYKGFDIDVSSIDFNREEIEKVFTVRIMDLLDPQKTRHEETHPAQNGTLKKSKVFQTPDAKIWGLTAYLLDKFLTQVFEPAVNKN